jgi:hypothetical protein
MTTDHAARQPKGIPAGGQFAATAHAEPELSLTAPKVASRGRTTNVTLPDGTVATRIHNFLDGQAITVQDAIDFQPGS